MKCLVTGGAGFIGSNLVDKLVAKNHKVIVIDDLSTGRIANLSKNKKNVTFFKYDISKDLSRFKNKLRNIDWIFHLAGKADIVPSINNPNEYFKSNVQGTLNILEIAKKNKIKKLIYAASASCYGLPNKFPTNEKADIDTKYPYALTKYLGEQLVLHWCEVYKMPNISMRFFNVYGQRSRTSGAYGAVFGVFLAQKLANKPLTIVGDGKQTRDFIHVFDLVNAMIKAAEKAKGSEIFNLGSGKETSVNEIADIISTNQINVPKRPGEPDRSMADINKIKELTKILEDNI
jgi:UDP-glucose 4-epimerase